MSKVTFLFVLLVVVFTESAIVKNNPSAEPGLSEVLGEDTPTIAFIGPSHTDRAICDSCFSAHAVNLGRSSADVEYDRVMVNALSRKGIKIIVIDLSLGILHLVNTDNWRHNTKLFIDASDDFNLRRSFHISAEPPYYKYYKAKYTKPNEVVDNGRFWKANYSEKGIVSDPSQFSDLESHNNYHSKQNFIKNKQKLREIIEVCRKNGIKLIFISPPKYHIYNESIDKAYRQERIDLLEELEIAASDFWDYEGFQEDNQFLFRDLNHMNEIGAKVFSAHLNPRLINLLSKIDTHEIRQTSRYSAR